MAFLNGLWAVITTIWSIFVDVTTTAVVDFMAVLPWPFKIFPDSYLGLFLLLVLIAVSIGIGFVAGIAADKAKKDPKAEPFWPAFGFGIVATFIIYTVVVAIIG